MNGTMIPPHPGLDTLTNVEELKHLCPAFSRGCPYAQIEEVNSITVSRGELSRCPAFKHGCPFSTKNEKEILTLMAQIPKDHPTLNMSELPSCDEGFNLVKMLNRFLDKTQLELLFDSKLNDKINTVPEQSSTTIDDSLYLKDPQLATAMREGTKAVHKAAESSVFTRRFLKGDINADEYGRYINSLYFVYKCMEELLNQHKNHPVVQMIYFPIELNREQSLLKDLAYFYGKDQVADLIRPESMTPAVKNYIQAMKEACIRNPVLLIAHSYSRYLGDLSGGQILANRLKEHILHLDDNHWDSTEGSNFYYFNNLGNQMEFKNIYRERLNDARVDQTIRDLVVAEAVLSFELNISLFDEIQALSEAGKLAPTLLSQRNRNKSNAIDGNKPISNIQYWISAVTVLTTCITLSALLYQRYSNQKN